MPVARNIKDGSAESGEAPCEVMRMVTSRGIGPLVVKLVRSASLGVAILGALPGMEGGQAWASPVQFNFTSGFGAGTDLIGRIVDQPPGGVPRLFSYGDPSFGGAPVHTGGDGTLGTSDSRAGTLGSATVTTRARADAASGRLGGFADAVGAATAEAGGFVTSNLYDTFTISLPPGVPPDVTLAWQLDGTLTQIPARTGLAPNATARINLRTRRPGGGFGGIGLIVDFATLVAPPLHSGTVDIDQAFFTSEGRPLADGDSFIIEALLEVIADAGGVDAGVPREAIADFGGSLSFSPFSSDPRITITSAARQAAAPVAAPSTLLPSGLGLLGFIAAAWRRRCQL